jgi:hypothetical protein
MPVSVSNRTPDQTSVTTITGTATSGSTILDISATAVPTAKVVAVAAAAATFPPTDSDTAVTSAVDNNPASRTASPSRVGRTRWTSISRNAAAEAVQSNIDDTSVNHYADIATLSLAIRRDGRTRVNLQIGTHVLTSGISAPLSEVDDDGAPCTTSGNDDYDAYGDGEDDHGAIVLTASGVVSNLSENNNAALVDFELSDNEIEF